MLTRLFPTRIVTSRRCGSAFMLLSVFAPRRPSSTSPSSLWGGSENMAISDEEKKAESPISMTIASAPSAPTMLFGTSAPPNCTPDWRAGTTADATSEASIDAERCAPAGLRLVIPANVRLRPQ
jgi:hypothetical protein